MTIQETIVDNMKNAMRSKDVVVRDLLRVVIGEFNREGKNLTDEESTKIIIRMVKGAKEVIKESTHSVIIQKMENEVSILEKYLPSKMDSDELAIKINEIIDDLECTSMKDMGRVMGELKASYTDQYDGKLASTLVRESLA